MSVVDEEELYYDEEEEATQLLNAEEVTLIATRFLRTGKQDWSQTN